MTDKQSSHRVEAVFACYLGHADKVVMIDGCFLTCNGRMLKKMIDEERIIHYDILPMYNKYNDIFAMEEVPQEEREHVAQEVARKILAELKEA